MSTELQYGVEIEVINEPDASWTDEAADTFLEDSNAKSSMVEDSVQMYLREIGQVKLLTAAQEIELA